MAVRPGAAPRGTAVRRVWTDALPEAASATAGVVWRGRSIRSCVFASFPLGAVGARPRVDGAPRPPGSVRSGRTPGASAKQDPCSGGPRVRVPCSRVLIACTGGTPGCGVRSDRARGSGTQAQPVEGRGRARDRHVRRLDPAPHRDLWIIFSTEVLPGGCPVGRDRAARARGIVADGCVVVNRAAAGVSTARGTSPV